MAKDEDFQKLLSEAPMAANADTVTVVGMLSRTTDASHFVLTLPDGRTAKIEVVAVKAAKKIAGAIGQTMVQLELDAKRVPEGLSEFRAEQPQLHYKIPAAETHPASAELSTSFADQGHTGAFDPVNTGSFDHVGTGAFDPTGTGAFDQAGTGAFDSAGSGAFFPMAVAAYADTPWYADTASSNAPFVASAPHQAHPAAMAALSLYNNSFNGPRTYLNGSVWTVDHHTVMKPSLDQA
jgi:hypothetical protein